ncbi:MAG: ABC transporter permease [Proteobacteria bacterium]|nr:ABC transporter permease [Pseudomonadota bacterium]
MATPRTEDGATAAAAAPTARVAARARNRALFASFYRRELVTRYLGSVTGLAWALLNPIVLLGVYAFVFTEVFPQRGVDAFLPFLAVGLWPWQASQEALQRATTTLGSYSALIRKVAFPHELTVYASTLATFTLHFAGYVAVLCILAAIGQPLHLSGLLLAVPLWCLLALAVTGLALITASLQVFIRDIEHVLPPLLMIAFYLTPILYPPSAVPAVVQPWLAANPFAWVVGRLRDALLHGNLALHAGDAVAVAIAVLLFVAGRWVFRRLSPRFEDYL